MTQPQQDARAVGASTRIPLGLAGTIIATVLGVGWSLSARLATIDLRLQALERAGDSDTIRSAVKSIYTIETRLGALEQSFVGLKEHGSDALVQMRISFELRVAQIESAVKKLEAECISFKEMSQWIEFSRAKGVQLPDMREK